jgi:hypothetical protein
MLSLRFDRRLCLLILLCVVGAIIPLYFNGLHTPLVGRDFTDIWLAGRAVHAGISPSNTPAFTAFGKGMFGNYLFNWPYPPPMLFAAVPISWLPHDVGFFVWNGATMLLFYMASRHFLPRELRLLAVLTPAAILCLIFGQTSFLVGALWFFAFRYAPLSALLLIKPHMGFLAGIGDRAWCWLWPLWLASLCRRRRMVPVPRLQCLDRRDRDHAHFTLRLSLRHDRDLRRVAALPLRAQAQSVGNGGYRDRLPKSGMGTRDRNLVRAAGPSCGARDPDFDGVFRPRRSPRLQI